ncbi:MAG TPA: hypothetical protein VG013_23495 [Gemmataceae bacterium]|jgi:hypothetical protein|nr:hypothetical protein [Gemmataceae bacterium]
MSENQQPNHDLLEEAIHAFQRMSVPERPLDAEVLGQFGSRQGDLSLPSSIPIPPKRRYFMHVVLSSAAAAVFLFGGLALFLRNSSPPESVQVAATASSGKAADIAVQPLQTSAGSKRESLREGLGTLEQHVAGAQVVVVATALDSAPAPPRRPGDLAEVLIRFRVKRVLKGKLTDKVITTRTPTAAGELIGKEWVILLSPEYMAGKHQYASCITVEVEATVKAIVSKGKRKLRDRS